jgi:hypothetical protein
MQPMVVLTKEQAKDRFSARLNEVAERLWGAEKADRPHTTLFHKELKKVVTYEAMRKWLSGESIPDMGHVSMICTALKIHPTWLLTELGPMFIEDGVTAESSNVVHIGKRAPFLDPEMSDLWGILSKDQKGTIEQLIRLEAAKADHTDKAKPKRKKRGG